MPRLQLTHQRKKKLTKILIAVHVSPFTLWNQTAGLQRPLQTRSSAGGLKDRGANEARLGGEITCEQIALQ